MIEKILQGKGVIVILVLLLAVALAPWYTMDYQIPRPRPHYEKKPSLPDLPTAFTGRSNEVRKLVHYLVTDHVSVVAVTGGPGYGKSSVTIVSSHELVKLGIPVYYVSLSEVDSIKTFIMALMHAIDGKLTEHLPEKGELLFWVSSLQTKTVVILDNADLLTLWQTELRNNFQKLLKDAVARSTYFHLVVTTRYRIKVANDFEEVHLDPLNSTEAVALLSRLVKSEQPRNKKDISSSDVHLHDIANKTGGIPLALKVVGVLLKSGIVSTAEVLNELAVDPLHALSRESFSPDEQLTRCFNISYKYLSQAMRKCLIYASRFPGTFDRRARDAIVANMTGDAHCLDQLVDRSLVEYSSMEERYTMHCLLRNFVTNSVTERPPKHKYFHLFCSHFILLLSVRITEARTGDVDNLYATITADYHNFLHLLHIYTNVSRDHPVVPHKEMLLFANQAFDVMKSRFPWERLVEWWTAVLKNVCRMVNTSEFELLAPPFLQLSTKFGNLLMCHKQYRLAGDILLFTDQCVCKDIILADSFTTCQHSQAQSYTSLLNALVKTYEEDGVVHRALEVRERLHSCIDSAPNKKPEELITENFCTVGIRYLREKHAQSKDFHSALQLFDAHYKCSGHLEDGTDELITMLENAPGYQSYDQFAKAFRIAKRCNMVGKYRKETVWLIKAAKFLETTSIKMKEVIMIAIQFRLTRLQWRVYNDAKKAVKHGRAAYTLAIKYPNEHADIFKTSLRLGDILHQIDGRQSEAGFYFNEALKHLPFVHADQEIIYHYQNYAELHLISIHFRTGEHRQCIQHYGQWASLELASASDHAHKIVDALFSESVSSLEKTASSLAVVDNSLDWFLGDSSIAKKFISAFMQKAHDSTIFYARLVALSIFTIAGVILGLMIVPCISCIGFRIGITTLKHIPSRIAYFIYLPFFSFHYFLFYTLIRHRLWVPHKLPIFPADFAFICMMALIMYIDLGIMIACLTSSFGLYFLHEQATFVYTPSLYYNMSMYLEDEHVYNAFVLP